MRRYATVTATSYHGPMPDMQKPLVSAAIPPPPPPPARGMSGHDRVLTARVAALHAAARSLADQAHTVDGLLSRAEQFEDWLLRTVPR